jgi:hypothetical protein
VANNLILDATGVAMRFSQPAAIAYLDHNVFGGPPGKVRVQFGRLTGDLEAHRSAGRMKNSRVEKLDFVDRDLAKLGGGSLANAGRPFDSLTFEGSAPDIGVAER